MIPVSSDSLYHTTETERANALKEFFAVVREAKIESANAVEVGKLALARLAVAVACRDHGQALRVRAILFSLYSGGAVLADVSDLMALDWSLRKDLCAVLLAFGYGDFEYTYVKFAFEQAGDRGADWFLDEGARASVS